MGEAKRRREQERQGLLRELDNLMEPPLENEAALCDEVMTIPEMQVPRASAAEMAYGRMKPNECHANCQAYARLDPSGEAKVVVGWLCDSAIPRVHSVIEVKGKLVCITPMGGLESSVFRPDPQLKHDLELDQVIWKGKRAPVLLRPNPQRTIAAAQEVRELILAGTNPADLSSNLLRDIGIAHRVIEERDRWAARR